MKAKDKAIQLVERFQYGNKTFKYENSLSYNQAKQCALMVVDEIFSIDIYTAFDIKPKYWQDVKDEIERL